MCGGHFVRMLVPVITASTEQITRMPAARAAIVHTPCPNCGSTIIPEFAWCPKCGAMLRTRLCSYCGQIVGPGDKTCTFCGAPPSKR